MHSNKKRTIFEILLAVALRVINVLIVFLFSVIITRSLPAEQAGFYFVSFSFLMFSGLVLRRGYDNTIIKYVSQSSSLNVSDLSILHYALKKTIPVSILFLIFSYAILIVLKSNYLIHEGQYLSFLFIMPAILFLISVTFIGMFFQGRSLINYSIPCQNFTHFIIAGVILTFVNVEYAYNVTLVLSLSFFISSCLYFYIAINKKSSGYKLSDELVDLIDNNAKNNWFHSVFSQGLQWIIPVWAAVWITPHEVAILSVSQRVAMATSFILIAINLVVSPRFAYLSREGDFSDTKALAVFVTKLLFALSLPILLFLYSFSEQILNFFGDGFTHSSDVLHIYLLGQFFSLFTGVSTSLMLMSGFESIMKRISFIAFSVTILSIPYFGKTAGAYGVAWSVTLGLFVTSVFSLIYVKKLFFNKV
ncbi:hypothetical protein BIZ37_29900 [Photobacterium sp. BZF1]|uniref:lipopolysaccharide biosynthesis protein n=1 Tax=Photobacterium sp. BZF1 TaxID=1904457 RepID=UPI0016534311|nr:MATE family efflux transporter [Photobacterium sp. BZF1]MBC7006761.1 hypothetical protein [Photobacterium sp. BZF1]